MTKNVTPHAVPLKLAEAALGSRTPLGPPWEFPWGVEFVLAVPFTIPRRWLVGRLGHCSRTLRRSAMGVAVVTFTCVPRLAAADEWWGTDKALHFSVSAGLASAAYAAAIPFTERREVRCIVGASASLLIGATKEGYDALGHGDPSWRDFTWDVAGTAVGVLVAYSLDYLIANASARPSAASATQPLTIRF
jgi:putative lipoprotein